MSGGGKTVPEITRSLMFADNLGDVHECINALHDLLGVQQPEGDFNDGWTDEDWDRIHAAVDEATQ